ncbi:hypothetical protein RA27_00280 [Ruegeria sp. ANG-R]|nr:hypothetical protein RA27_00280 [Ruegeria sp. ANG-R]
MGIAKPATVFWTYEVVASTEPRIFHLLVHPTGEWAARLLILAMMITPLMLLFKTASQAMTAGRFPSRFSTRLSGENMKSLHSSNRLWVGQKTL